MSVFTKGKQTKKTFASARIKVSKICELSTRLTMNYLVFKPEGVAQMKDTAQINYFSRFLAKYST